MIEPGAVLTDAKRRWRATLRLDGSLECRFEGGSTTGSIHRVGAQVQGAASCNGWTFWHQEGADGSLEPIDAVRTLYRRALAPPLFP